MNLSTKSNNDIHQQLTKHGMDSNLDENGCHLQILEALNKTPIQTGKMDEHINKCQYAG
jgi:hypothetical protein